MPFALGNTATTIRLINGDGKPVKALRRTHLKYPFVLTILALLFALFNGPLVLAQTVAPLGGLTQFEKAAFIVPGTFGNSSRSAISTLFAFRDPSTVAWFIISVIVGTVNAMRRRWPTAHIFQKIRKTVSPTSAYRDAATAVVREVFALRIFAALSHVRPCAIFRPAFSDFISAMLSSRIASGQPSCLFFGASHICP